MTSRNILILGFAVVGLMGLPYATPDDDPVRRRPPRGLT
jgi:hypothetical protein